MTRRQFTALLPAAALAANQQLPAFEDTKPNLPAPIYDAEPAWLDLYWKARELAFRNFHQPAPASGFPSRFIDAAFNQNIFMWDTCFMTMFCNYAHPLVPGIGSLDNFYAKQFPDGEISREILRDSGETYPPWVNRENAPLFSRWGFRPGKQPSAIRYVGRVPPSPNPALTLDGLNHPILAWAELESYRITGDRARLARVSPPLKRFFLALKTYLRQGNGLYMTDWASMDNSPRNPWLEAGGAGVDISAEMVLFARNLAQIERLLSRPADAALFDREAAAIAQPLNRLMWDDATGFYYDLNLENRRGPSRTIAAYWTLIAQVASPQQAAALARELKKPATFGRRNLTPTCAATDPVFNPRGGYWQGAVWAPTTTMVMRGLENYGYRALAHEIAFNHLRMMTDVYRATGTIWENYAPDSAEPGKPAKKDFVGWSGIGPIMYLLEYAIGLQPDAAHNRLHWKIPAGVRCGCERFRFNGRVVSLLAEPGKRRTTIHADSTAPFRLQLQAGAKTQTVPIAAGKQTFALEA
jgi:hypothetical protein